MDSRIRYTKFRIKIAFFELLKNCPVDRMTVKGICDIAMVNRQLFINTTTAPQTLWRRLKRRCLTVSRNS